MASIVVEVQLFAAFPDSVIYVTSRQFRHDSNYYASTVRPLTMKAITGFLTSGTIHLRLQRHRSGELHIQDHCI